MAALLDEAGVELVCLAGYMRLLSDWFVDRYEGHVSDYVRERRRAVSPTPI